MDQRCWPSGERPDPVVHAQAMAEVAAMRLHRMDQARSTANWAPLGPLAWNSTSYNPGNGRVNTLMVDPTNPQVIYAGTPSAGLWRSTNGAGTWQAMFTDLPSMGVSGIVVDPTNPAVIYIATGDGDGGDTYGTGVMKSTDAGTTWLPTGLNWNLTQTLTTRCLRMAASNQQTLLCAASNGVFRTTDGGTTWAQVRSGSFRDVEFQPGNDLVVYACDNTFNRSTDGGAHFFLQTNNGLPSGSQVGRMAIAVSPSEPLTVYVLCSKESDGGYLGLYRSTDGGLSFSLRSSTPNLFGYEEDGSDTGGQSWYDMALAVDPSDASSVYLGGINVWKSTDGGFSWTIKSHWVFPSTIGYTHADIHTLDFMGDRLFCGSDGGLHMSVNGAEEWTDLSAGLDITQFYRMGGSEMLPYKFVAGAQDNGTNLLLNGNWTHVYGADGMEAAIDPWSPEVLYGSFQNGGLIRSVDNGASWINIGSNVSEEGAWVTPFLVDVNAPEHLVAGFFNVWETWDRGNTWNMLTNWDESDHVRCLAMAPSNSEVLYVARQDLIQRSVDGGLNWITIDNGLPTLTPTSFAVSPDDPLHVYVSFSGTMDGQKVYASSDGGLSWTNRSANLPNLPANSLVCQPGTANGLYVGTDMGVFYTSDEFLDWQPFGQGLPNVVVSELEVNLSAGKLRAATFGRGLWESDLFTSNVGVKNVSGSTPPRLVPLDQQGRFAWAPDGTRAFNVVGVLDALGRALQHVRMSTGGPGVLDLSANAPGVYLVQVTDGHQTWTLRVVR